MRMGTAVGLVVLSLVAACGSSTAPEERLRIGVIFDLDIDAPRIVVPDAVEAGGTFLVEVKTIGNSCVRKGETEVDRREGSVTITPLDWYRTGPTDCEDIGLIFDHEALIEAGEPGVLVVEIVGRRWPSEEPVTLRREVEVTPPAP